MTYLVVLAVFLLTVNGQQSRLLPNSSDPDKPGYCLHKDLKLSFREGDQVYPTNIGECVAFACNKNGVIAVNDCADFSTHDHCTIKPADLTKIYPDCCAACSNI